VLLAVSCNDTNPGSPIDGSVLTLDVVPANAWLVAGSTLRLEAIARDSTGTVINRPVTWSSTDSRVVSIDTARRRRRRQRHDVAEAAGGGDRHRDDGRRSGTWSIEHEGDGRSILASGPMLHPLAIVAIRWAS
jgi:hypothetical protein